MAAVEPSMVIGSVTVSWPLVSTMVELAVKLNWIVSFIWAAISSARREPGLLSVVLVTVRRPAAAEGGAARAGMTSRVLGGVKATLKLSARSRRTIRSGGGGIEASS